MNNSGKLHFPNLKSFLLDKGFIFSDWVKEASKYHKIGRPLAERTWHNACAGKTGASQKSINTMISLSTSVFKAKEIEFSDDVLEIKKIYQ